MARRSFLRVAGVIENMSSFTTPSGEEFALFGSGGGQALADEIGAELLGQVPIEPAVANAGDTGEPLVIGGTGPAVDAFRRIADLIVSETVPMAQMDGCSARLDDDADASLADGVPVTLRRAI
jgi:ATP-binding protein involved in chromosome partitioning